MIKKILEQRNIFLNYYKLYIVYFNLNIFLENNK